MSRWAAAVGGWIGGVLLFAAIWVGCWFWVMGIWHGEINARLAQWPAHRATVTGVQHDDVTPDGETKDVTVGFADYSGQHQTARVTLPGFYRVGMTLPVRVNASGAAYVPQAFYDNYGDPTKVYAGYYPVFALMLYTTVDAILSLVAGVALTCGLARVRLPQLRGRLGTR